jgi:hypothetical protein
LSKSFSASIEMIVWFLSLFLYMCCIGFIDLPIWASLAVLEWNWLDHGA